MCGEIEAQIWELRAECLYLRNIADALTFADVPTAAGGKWWPATVRKVLGREPPRPDPRAWESYEPF